MTKWFDTNYHYMVPEVEPEPGVRAIGSLKAIDEFKEAKALGYHTRPVDPRAGDLAAAGQV